MRDARPQSREKRRTRRDRYLAGRSEVLSEAYLRITAATILDAGAFVLWNLSSRSPLRVFRDVCAGVRGVRTFAHGLSVFLAGLVLLVAGAWMLVPIAISSRVFLVIETWAILTGLLAEQLAGDDVWTGLGIRRSR